MTNWTEEDGLLTHAGLSEAGLVHGFTTRRLGNMKSPEARAAAAARLGLTGALTLKQVHGTTIYSADAGNAGREGDGWLLGAPGQAAGVYTADCVPLYLWTDDARAAGVFHAGWRGTAAGMAAAAVRAFAAVFAQPGELNAALGPHIGACCYKVGPELEKSFPVSSFVRRDGALWLDLAAETRRQLLEAGLDEDKVDAAAPCTASNADDFHSFRRDKQDARMLALLAID